MSRPEHSVPEHVASERVASEHPASEHAASEHAVDEAGWARFVARHGVGDVLDGHVVSVVPFGAFIRVADGIDGFAPQSLWPTRPQRDARLRVRIAAIDPDNRRCAFGPE